MGLSGLRNWGVVVLLVLSSAAAQAAPAPGVDWDWQLSETIRPPAGIAVFDADKDSVTRDEIMALNAAGVYTICYVSVGTTETYRDDVNVFHDMSIFGRPVVGKRYEDWPDEFFLDITNPALHLVMQRRFLECAMKGFQAVEPDNMDVYQNDSGFEITAEDTIRYLETLVQDAHSVGLEIGQKNVPELTDRLVGMMDFIITESCFQDDWCQDVTAYLAAGKPVFDAEYTDRPIDWRKACRAAKWLNISMILKDRDLNPGRKSCNE